MALNQLQYDANSHAVHAGYVLHRALVNLVVRVNSSSSLC